MVPIPAGEKGPRSANWTSRDFKASDVRENDNIGVKCGVDSQNRVDIDLDCPETVRLAGAMLPATGLIHGRESRPSSHRWYVAPGLKTEQFQDTNGEMLVEIRSTGAQTIIPPSVHPSGEAIEWVHNRPAAVVVPDELRKGVAVLAVTALLARHWPQDGGSRHAVAMSAAGFLSNKLSPEEVGAVIENASEVAGDEETKDRARAAQDTAAKKKAGKKVVGGPRLSEHLGQPVVDKIHKWLGGEEDDAIEEVNQRFFSTSLGGSYVVGREEDEGDVTFMSEDTFKKLFQHRTVNRGKKSVELGFAWSKSPRKRMFERAEFCPPPKVCPDKIYNLWKGFAVEPSAEGSCDKWLAHVRDVVCSGVDEYYEYVMNWLARVVQAPGSPSEVAMVLRGQRGTGKGRFVEEFGALFGPHYLSLNKVGQLVGNFNAHLSGKVVVFADEAFWGGDKKDEGTLKALITGHDRVIERKGIDTVREANTMNMIMATNEDWAVPVGSYERRFFVLDISNKYRQDLVYFGAMIDEMNAGGREHLLYVLQNRKVTANDIRKVPVTPALREQQDLTLSPFHKWWLHCLMQGGAVTSDQGDVWTKPASIHLLFESFQRDTSAARWGKKMQIDFLRDLDALTKGSKKTRKKGIVITSSGPIQGQCLHIQLPSLEACRKQFDSYTGFRREWEVPTHDTDEDDPFSGIVR